MNNIFNNCNSYLTESHSKEDEEELKKITQRGYLLMNKYTQDWYASVFINKLNSILNS